MTPDQFADHARSRGGTVVQRGTGRYAVTCQVSGHGQGRGDRNPSLTVKPGTKGRETVLFCEVGCTEADAVDAYGLTVDDLKPPRKDKRSGHAGKVVATYDGYVNEHGAPLYYKDRIEPGKNGRSKECLYYRVLPGGVRKYKDVFKGPGAPKRVPWRIPAIAEAVKTGRRIYWGEGEPSVLALERLGEVASTAGSCEDWRPDFADYFDGAAEVVIIADNDVPGFKHARRVAAALADKVEKVTIVRGLVDEVGADIVDHLAAGHGLDDLIPVEDEPPAAEQDIPEQSPRASADADGDEEKKGRGPSQASLLAALARERYELFMSEDGRPYGVKKDGANIALPLRGKAGLRSQLSLLFTDANGGSVPSQSALADAMTVLEGAAQSAESRVPHLRVARHDGRIVVDLGTPDGACVIIGPEGWERSAKSPVLFRRSGAMKPLPTPTRDGDGLAKLRRLLNMSDQSFHLLVAWLVACFIPDLPHPILTFRGEQGTGKSYAAKMVIGIVDPSGAPKRTAPRDMKSWATQAFNSWALCLDNVSIIPDWLSDALCRAVTGDGIVDRALYTDDDVVVLEFRRVLAMTTIDAGALAGDLAERLLTIELHTIPDRDRREEAEMDAAYAEAHASILASLFDLLAQVLKVLPDVELTERPRMADFARVLAAVDQVKGWETSESYSDSARDAVADVLDGEPFAQAVVAMVDRAGPGGLTLTAQQILDTVDTPDKPPKKWPKDATRAGGQLKRLAPALRTIGVEVDDSQRGPAPKRQRMYKLTASPERRCETASTASSGSEKAPLTSGNRVDAATDATASTPGADMDARDAAVDAPLFAASTTDTASDQRESAGMDAGDAMDAEMHALSNPAADDGFTLDPDADDGLMEF